MHFYAKGNKDEELDLTPPSIVDIISPLKWIYPRSKECPLNPNGNYQKADAIGVEPMMPSKP
jgi:hypothetical protein